MSYMGVLIPPTARLFCFLQIAHFSSTLTQDGKAAVYSCQTQGLAPYSLKKKALTKIFEPCFSLLYPVQRDLD